MSIENQQSAPASTEKLSEKEYADALARMNKIKDQLATLRMDVPDMFANFCGTHDTPEALYSGFEQSAVSLTKGLAELKASWRDSQTQKVLDTAKKSHETDPVVDNEHVLTFEDPGFDFTQLDFLDDVGSNPDEKRHS